MAKNINNMDLRIRMLQIGASQRQVAEVMGIRTDFLCRAMSAERMTDSFRARILAAIQQIEKQQKGKS